MKKSSVLNAGLAAVVALAFAACGAPPAGQREEPISRTSLMEQRVIDLVAINTALQQYHSTHGSFPASDEAQGYASSYGGSLGANWIPELNTTLPRDPALSEAGSGAQYLYMSNGTDYKLIAHATGDCSAAVEIDGVRIDPRRTDAATCWAYGFWSAGGESF